MSHFVLKVHDQREPAPTVLHVDFAVEDGAREFARMRLLADQNIEAIDVCRGAREVERVDRCAKTLHYEQA